MPAMDLPADSGSVSREAPGLDDGREGGRKVWGCRTVDRGCGRFNTALPEPWAAARWCRVTPLMNSKWSANGFASEEF